MKNLQPYQDFINESLSKKEIYFFVRSWIGDEPYYSDKNIQQVLDILDSSNIKNKDLKVMSFNQSTPDAEMKATHRIVQTLMRRVDFSKLDSQLLKGDRLKDLLWGIVKMSSGKTPLLQESQSYGNLDEVPKADDGNLEALANRTSSPVKYSREKYAQIKNSLKSKMKEMGIIEVFKRDNSWDDFIFLQLDFPNREIEQQFRKLF